MTEINLGPTPDLSIDMPAARHFGPALKLRPADQFEAETSTPNQAIIALSGISRP